MLRKAYPMRFMSVFALVLVVGCGSSSSPSEMTAESMGGQEPMAKAPEHAGSPSGSPAQNSSPKTEAPVAQTGPNTSPDAGSPAPSVSVSPPGMPPVTPVTPVSPTPDAGTVTPPAQMPDASPPKTQPDAMPMAPKPDAGMLPATNRPIGAPCTVSPYDAKCRTNYCDEKTHTCQLLPNGKTCLTANPEFCQSGFCVNTSPAFDPKGMGVCCNTMCGGVWPNTNACYSCHGQEPMVPDGTCAINQSHNNYLLSHGQPACPAPAP